ncbi:3-deoxy-7-phosphoheptulonate synthase [Vagococcus sp.]|uniref:3-deoxy-7-phosphoheptulonate synthase n=1 Tax=Vagococcus sp. TaxID=1933889 RepID=UPI003F9678F1
MAFKIIGEKIELEKVIDNYQLTKEQRAFKDKRDEELKLILSGQDQRLLIIVGPCSAHDEEAVIAYTKKLKKLQTELKDKLFLLPRIYTNKPRTNGTGYKGLMEQPNCNKPSNWLEGVEVARRLHYRVLTEVGLTTADELLYPETLPFIEDLVSYFAIGARSVENQGHRFVASGLSQPVGMKNPTSGDLNVLFHSIFAAQQEHEFLIQQNVVKTTGNKRTHLILRGCQTQTSDFKPNYHYEDLCDVLSRYEASELSNPFVIIDANHDNSGKKEHEQIRIVREVQMNRAWNPSLATLVRGFMIESFLESGKQDEQNQHFGRSITDPCLGFEKTAQLLRDM